MFNILLISPYQLTIESFQSLFLNQHSYTIFSQLVKDEKSTNLRCKEKVDIVLVDTDYQVFNGVVLIDRLKKQYEEAKIILLANEFNAHHVRKLLAKGINGYLLKDRSSTNLFEAISKIIGGEEYYDDRLKNLLLQSYQPNKKKTATRNSLTKREKEVVKYIANGCNIKEIAEKMFVSKSTVESHKKNVYIKLGVNKTALLVRYALNQGIID